MNPRVIAHPANLQGRDFIVGDLHGHPDVLRRLMDYVAFDYDTDRLFSVGDLVDRGPDSAGALDLLDEPWFYPVLGTPTLHRVTYWLTWIDVWFCIMLLAPLFWLAETTPVALSKALLLMVASEPILVISVETLPSL
ncbi:hypothetical protein BBC27_11345 [Acidithiobacillus ferrivorans]|uniref:Calcineurin-like phosphoesterase domain-containing protein n=1 Tax=Acidithiobacillus ferrivorans TaxID=160808 RepID=A0A1B9BYL1_9PROT|nr:metallophosphoesterase [Acidithiobacillus ferrivorans]OCB02809.1 hypothetical protein BBC27_11345 [Acidithiobacillus ferrivorans]